MQRSGDVDRHKEYGERDDSGEPVLTDDNAVGSFLLVDEKEKIMVRISIGIRIVIKGEGLHSTQTGFSIHFCIGIWR